MQRHDVREVEQLMQRGEVDVVLILDRDMGVQVLVDGTEPNQAQMRAVYLQNILSDMQISGVNVRMLFNPQQKSEYNFVPAVIGMVIMLICAMMTSVSIVREKELGTIEQINVSPIGKMTFILSKIIPYAVVGLLMTVESMLASRALYGILPSGSVALLLASSVMFAVVVSSIGLIISNFSSTLQQAALTMFFFLVIFILMSGLLTPIASMPEWAQTLTLINPTRYFIEVARGIFIKGCTASQLLPQYAAITAFAIAGWASAIASYRKKM